MFGSEISNPAVLSTGSAGAEGVTSISAGTNSEGTSRTNSFTVAVGSEVAGCSLISTGGAEVTTGSGFFSMGAGAAMGGGTVTTGAGVAGAEAARKPYLRAASP